MAPRFLAAISALSILLVFTFTGLQDPSVSASPQELTVKSRAKGYEELKADFLNEGVRIRLQNNHKKTMTAFAIRFGSTTVKVDFAYSEVHSGIEPGDTLEESYSFSRLSVSRAYVGTEIPTLHLLAVLLKDGTTDGDAKVVQEIKDQRLGQKIQLHRMLKILAKEALSGKDIKALKGEITAALDAGEDDARIIRKELLPASGIDEDLSESLKKGLFWGREKILRSLQALEHLPIERQEEAFIELKNQAHKLFAKL